MDNALIDVSIRTMVGNLPGIINENNKYITEEFDKIVNNNKYVLDVSSNNIAGKNGVFTNLTVDGISINSLSIKNQTQFDNKIKDVRDGIDLTGLMDGTVSEKELVDNNGNHLTINDLYKLKLYVRKGSVTVPVQVGFKCSNNAYSYMLYYDVLDFTNSTKIVKRKYVFVDFNNSNKLVNTSTGEITL